MFTALNLDLPATGETRAHSQVAPAKDGAFAAVMAKVPDQSKLADEPAPTQTTKAEEDALAADMDADSNAEADADDLLDSDDIGGASAPAIEIPVSDIIRPQAEVQSEQTQPHGARLDEGALPATGAARESAPLLQRSAPALTSTDSSAGLTAQFPATSARAARPANASFVATGADGTVLDTRAMLQVARASAFAPPPGVAVGALPHTEPAPSVRVVAEAGTSLLQRTEPAQPEGPKATVARAEPDPAALPRTETSGQETRRAEPARPGASVAAPNPAIQAVFDLRAGVAAWSAPKPRSMTAQTLTSSSLDATGAAAAQFDRDRSGRTWNDVRLPAASAPQDTSPRLPVQADAAGMPSEDDSAPKLTSEPISNGGLPDLDPFGTTSRIIASHDLAKHAPAFAGAGNHAALETAQAIGRQIATQVPSAAGQRFEISLAPAELGSVTLKLIGTDDGSVLVIQADRPETLDLMRRHVATLESELRSLGHDSLSVRFTGTGAGGPGSGGGNLGGAGTGAHGNPQPPEGAVASAPAAAREPPGQPTRSPPRIASDHLDLRL